MSYLLESKQSVLDSINAANGTSYKLTDIVFGVPQPTLGSWMGNATTRNSTVRLSAPPGGTYAGSKVVTYDRLKLNDLDKVKGFKINRTNPVDVYDILPFIRYYAGVNLTQDDVENSAVTADGNGNYTATLTAKASSIGWIGSLPITIYPGGERLEDSIVDSSLDGLNYPTALDTDIYGLFYLYPYDFTSRYNDFVDIEEGAPLTTPQVDMLLAAITAVDISSGKTLWNKDGAATAWSLFGATCVHNGLNGSDYPTNSTYKYVLVIRLRSGVTTPAGDLYLHYNDPLV